MSILDADSTDHPTKIAARSPGLAERRESKKRQLQEAISRELSAIAERKGTKCKWSSSKCAEMDALCLKEGKRCVMWSDAGTGWYLLLNWDWTTNRPRTKEEDENIDAKSDKRKYLPGYYEDLREVLKPPLLDGSVPPDQLAAWIDQNTISIHDGLMDGLMDGRFKLEDF